MTGIHSLNLWLHIRLDATFGLGEQSEGYCINCWPLNFTDRGNQPAMKARKPSDAPFCQHLRPYLSHFMYNEKLLREEVAFARPVYRNELISYIMIMIP